MDRLYRSGALTRQPPGGGSAPPLLVRTGESELRLKPGSWYLVGRDPQADVVISDARVSWQHAVLRMEEGRWVLADNGGTNGTYAEGRRVDRIEIDGDCLVRLSDPAEGPALCCTLSGSSPSLPGAASGTMRIGRAPDNDIVVSDLSVSSHHAELHTFGGACRIVDLDSHNGTFVNEQRVTTAALRDGDVVGLGNATYRLVGQALQDFTYPGGVAGETRLPATEGGPPATEARLPATEARLPAAEARLPAAEGGPPAVAVVDNGVGDSDGMLEIPYAVRWLVPRGERFAILASLPWRRSSTGRGTPSSRSRSGSGSAWRRRSRS